MDSFPEEHGPDEGIPRTDAPSNPFHVGADLAMLSDLPIRDVDRRSGTSS
jgi:hypothetical protein